MLEIQCSSAALQAAERKQRNRYVLLKLLRLTYFLAKNRILHTTVYRRLLDLQKGFKCAHWNVQSICNKMEELTLLLCGSTNSMDFVAITETWLNDSYNDAWTSIPGFNCERRDRNSSQRGGGIVVYLNENFPYSRRLDYESISPHLECIWIELKVPCIGSIKICTAYRSPSLSVSSWTNDFEDMLEVIYLGDSNVIITGDFNIDLLNHESATRKRWLDLLTITYNFTSLVPNTYNQGWSVYCRPPFCFKSSNCHCCDHPKDKL